jgi:hypothetical protein
MNPEECLLCEWEATTSCNRDCQCYDIKEQLRGKKRVNNAVEALTIISALVLIVPFIIVWTIAATIGAVIEWFSPLTDAIKIARGK